MVAVAEGVQAPPQAALGLHEGIANRGGGGGCLRWPPGLWLESTLGQRVPGRCRATNLCPYCARLAAVENAEVLAQDAMTNTPPTLWTVLGTRTATIDTGRFRGARIAVRQAVKRRWPAAEAATVIEFTTGYGANAGGERRPHWNDTWKGIPVDDAEELHAVQLRAWLASVDATRKAHQFDRCVRPIEEMGGLMRYLALHFQKESQQPPEGWRGHRFRTTRGYLAEPMPAARERARQALRLRRELWRAERQGLAGEAALAAAETALYEANELAWTLVRETQLPAEFGPDGLPTAWSPAYVEVRR